MNPVLFKAIVKFCTTNQEMYLQPTYRLFKQEETNNKLSVHGFRSNYSCSMAVSKISSEIIKNTDDKKTTC